MHHDSSVVSKERRSFCLGAARGAAIAVAGNVVPGFAAGPSAAVPQRQNIEAMDPSKLAKIEAAIGEMMERSKKNTNDPKGWLANAEPHNAFCAQPGQGAAQIHFCYWFLPWHRAYLLVTERKIREIAGDSSLCLPYWNWSSTRRIPARFARQGSPLANAVRYTEQRDLDPSEIDYLAEDPALRQLGVAALGASRFVAAPTSDRAQFARNLANSFGGVARPNPNSAYGNSRLEGTPHGPVHGYVGGRDSATLRLGDMANFATAARDPIFFAHHGNLDRLWEIWRSTGSNRAQEPTGTAFLKRTFAFPWLDGSAMEVSVSETLDMAKIGYAYDNLKVFDQAAPAEFKPEAFAQAGRLPSIANSNLQVPPTPESAVGAPARYILEIEGVQSPRRVLSAGVYVHRTGMAEPKVLVGSISVVRNGEEYQVPNDVLIFDVTAAVNTLQSNQLSVSIIPNRIGSEEVEPYRPLRYRRMRIVRD